MPHGLVFRSCKSKVRSMHTQMFPCEAIPDSSDSREYCANHRSLQSAFPPAVPCRSSRPRQSPRPAGRSDIHHGLSILPALKDTVLRHTEYCYAHHVRSSVPVFHPFHIPHPYPPGTQSVLSRFLSPLSSRHKTTRLYLQPQTLYAAL